VPDTGFSQPGTPLGRQVRVGLTGLLALLVVLTAVAILLVVNLSQHDDQLKDDVPWASAIAAAALDAKGVANDQRGFLLTGDATYLNEATQRAAAARREFATAAAKAVTDTQRRAVNESLAGFERWWTATQSEFAAYRDGNTQAAIAASVGPDRALRKQYEDSLARTQNLSQTSLQSATRSITSAATRSVAILLGCLLAALLAGAAIAYWLVRQISTPLFRLATILTSDTP
jgi:methyl-accepting chemotaxis protein